jgi:hypothetical protein
MTLRELCNKAGLEKVKSVFIVDGETDGLYGSVFAISAVVADIDTFDIKDIFSSQIEMNAYECLSDSWVKDNVVPAIEKGSKCILTDKVHKNELLSDFWNFYSAWNDGTTLFLADFGAPVEANLFRKCVLADLYTRNFSGPYPLHELGTILLLNGYDPDMSRDNYYSNVEFKHHPYFDCESSLNILKEIYLPK